MSGEVGNFLLDLVNIEVNTIIKSGMTAEKMPEPRLAIHRVLVDYAGFLSEAEVDTDSKLTLDGLPRQAKFEKREAFALDQVKDEIRMLSAVAERQHEAAQGTPRRAVLARIITNLRVLSDLKLDELEMKQRLMIRKMWEIGTEEVVVQTCISLDGDVVTRIDPQLLDKAADLREVLLGVHRESTTISIRFWSALASAATTIIEGIGTRWSRFGK